MTIFLLIVCTLISHAQTDIGIDMSALLFREIKVSIGHGISGHWSARAEAGISMKALKRKISKEEIWHDKEFTSSVQLYDRTFTHRESLSICYWPRTCFQGTFLSVGGEYRQGKGLDATIGIGYMYRIWKGLAGVIRYETCILGAAGAETLSVQNLGVGLNWIF